MAGGVDADLAAAQESVERIARDQPPIEQRGQRLAQARLTELGEQQRNIGIFERDPASDRQRAVERGLDEARCLGFIGEIEPGIDAGLERELVQQRQAERIDGADADVRGARGRQLAAAWFTGKDDKGQAFAAFSDDAGRTWGNPIRLDDGASLGHVDIELLDEGSAVATWVEFANERSQFRMRRIESSGAKSPAITINGTSRVSGYPRVARSGNELVFTWTEGSEGEGTQKVRGAVAKLP
jgi:hypothetical protein